MIETMRMTGIYPHGKCLNRKLSKAVTTANHRRVSEKTLDDCYKHPEGSLGKNFSIIKLGGKPGHPEVEEESDISENLVSHSLVGEVVLQ
jgi:hypothetical protein